MELVIPCEIAARELLPAIRSLIAEKLIKDKQLSIYRAAILMNVTPAAITNYLKGKRGKITKDMLINDEKFRKKLDNAVENLISGKENIIKILCYLCSEGKRILNNNGYNIGVCAYEFSQSSFY
jgi:predicted transcriptional regulator